MTSPSPLERLAGPGNVLGKEAADAKEFDGVAELWWDSWDALAANASNPAAAKAGAELLEDERTFIDLESSPLWWSEEHEIVAPR